MEGFQGPHCEIIGIGFYGNGWAMYPTIAACDEARLSLELEPHKEDGLVFYVGPVVPNPSLDVQGKSKSHPLLPLVACASLYKSECKLG
jgi:hypothetical protein